MTKRELINMLEANKLSDDTEVLISVGKYHENEATWAEIAGVDKTEHGEPILIYPGITIMA